MSLNNKQPVIKRNYGIEGAGIVALISLAGRLSMTGCTVAVITCRSSPVAAPQLAFSHNNTAFLLIICFLRGRFAVEYDVIC